MESNNKVLLFIETSSIEEKNDKTKRYYKNINLIEEKTNSTKDLKYYLNDKLVFVNKQSNCNLLEQSFDHFLIIF